MNYENTYCWQYYHTCAIAIDEGELSAIRQTRERLNKFPCVPYIVKLDWSLTNRNQATNSSMEIPPFLQLKQYI